MKIGIWNLKSEIRNLNITIQNCRLLHSIVCVAALLASGCQHPLNSFPIGIYSVPKGELREVRAAGFDVVTGPASRDYLDAARQYGLKVLASPGTSAGKGFQADRARATVARFDSHPALWAWYLVDEPDLNGVSPDQVRAAQRFLKNIGAHKPTALVLFQGAEAFNFASIADFTMVDRYPIPWLPLANFPQNIRMARLALGKERPLIAVVQAFDWSFYPKLRPTEGPMRPPSWKEMRSMAYSALARRANGLFFYCFDDGAWRMQNHPETWEALRKLVAEIKERRPLFEGEHIWWPYVHEFSDPATGFNEALESSVTPALLQITTDSRSVLKGQYLLAVNNTERELTYRITLPKRLEQIVAVLGEARDAKVTDGWLEDNFGPFDVHIYGPIQ